LFLTTCADLTFLTTLDHAISDQLDQRGRNRIKTESMMNNAYADLTFNQQRERVNRDV